MTVDEEARTPEPVPPATPRRRALRFAIVAFGAGVVVLMAQRAPREQHLRLVLGDAAPEVRGLVVTYVGDGGDVAREARFSFGPGQAPRIVAHDPSLADGPYLLRIEAETREGRRTTERQVTLGGGTTQVDLTSALFRSPALP